ncbi:DNA-3-methyladenine glycosylase [Rhodococcus sp. X156]|uniref:DNA-3-methyladenine glycosylase n=1 Tax=Rhodococcus sp. X156 TaxID=2499145 RepID=UPI000FD856F5|nr:DNA-3-methyladenine glycosylase [Rhodococcus sp. X156]
MSARLDAQFFARPAVEVAPQLLGCVLHHGEVALRITEVEAYMGEVDPGSHAYRGESRRNSAMFGPPGHLYVYAHMGLHHCANLVCSPAGTAHGVLLRAGEVIAGAEVAMARRNVGKGVCRTEIDLARGPARLTVALGLTLADNHASVVDPGGDLCVTAAAEPVPAASIVQGPRVGVGGEGGDAERFPWRYWIAGDPTVSLYKAAPPPKKRRQEARP